MNKQNESGLPEPRKQDRRAEQVGTAASETEDLTPEKAWAAFYEAVRKSVQGMRE